MTTFIGKTEVKADEKGRIFIPASYRKILAQTGQRRLVMRKEADNECLVVFTEDVWTARVESLASNLNEWDPNDQMILMQFVGEAEVLDIDNQGRILISKKNLQSIGASQDLLLVGMMNKFAIWDRLTYENKMASAEEFATVLTNKMKKN